ncbi:MAG: radical SAM protein [Spirochaetes bacterium]|nr:radical SAM protein [Spirochaetota bacterium]
MGTYASKKFDLNLIEGIIKAVRVWTGMNPVRMVTLWKRFLNVQRATRIRQKLNKTEGLIIPPVLILSSTMKCNLTCPGCYSREYPTENELTLDEIDSLLTQAEEIGVSFFIITGGEPLMNPDLLDLIGKHRSILFFLFNNGTFIDSDTVNKIRQHDHIIPILSTEGNEDYTDSRRGKGVYQKVIKCMELMKKAGIFFGFSCMVSKQNITLAGKDAFIDSMISKGCRMGFYVAYVPSAKKADLLQVPEKEEQALFRKQVKKFHKDKKIILVHLPDDEYEVGGSCMAAGKGFLHINAQGDIEPCPFAHLAADSLRTSSLRDAVQSKFFKHIRENQDLLQKPHLGCALFERREELKRIAVRMGAKPTEKGWQ